MTSDAHARIRDAVSAITDRWDLVLSLLEVERKHNTLRLFDTIPDGPWSQYSRAAKAALAVERDVGLPGLAELVCLHEWLKTRSTVTP